MQRVVTEAGERQLKGLIEEHLEAANSSKAKRILDNWSEEMAKFWQLVPPSEKSTPEASKAEEQSNAVPTDGVAAVKN